MATTNTDMGNMLRQRRKDLSDLPAYEGPPSDSADTPPESESTYTVKAPGEASTGEGFEYEPSSSSPGAWVVYPPGVPCDDTQYRVTMTGPAAASDFSGMQAALDKASGEESGESGDTSVVSELDSDGRDY